MTFQDAATAIIRLIPEAAAWEDSDFEARVMSIIADAALTARQAAEWDQKHHERRMKIREYAVYRKRRRAMQADREMAARGAVSGNRAVGNEGEFLGGGG